MGRFSTRAPHRRGRAHAVPVALILASWCVAGCDTGHGLVTTTTCADYARLEVVQRNVAISDRLHAHKFTDLNRQLLEQVDNSVDAFCGGPFDPGGNDTARLHGADPIDNGVRWDRLSI